ncbi:MAG: MFS transporter [Acetobacteraceae bacterium]
MPPVAIGYLASSVFTGMLVGSIAIGMLADRIGRKHALIFAVGFYGPHQPRRRLRLELRVARRHPHHRGLRARAEVPLVFTYLSEFMPRRHRGVLLASSVFFWQGASFIAALAAVFVVPTFGWRGMFVLGVLPSLVLVVLFLRLPESVRFLLSRAGWRRPSALPAGSAPSTRRS